MKIAVITDVHANLPALRAVLDAITREGVELIVHTGDAIAIGPHPAECLDMLLALPNARMVLGNHDALFAFGLPEPQPIWMSDGEVSHQRWTHAQIDPGLRAAVAGWPKYLALDLNGVRTAFVHYALDAAGQRLQTPLRNPTAADLDAAFSVYNPDGAELIFYGHTHKFSDVTGHARHVNPGAVGCGPTATAPYTLMEADGGGRYRLEHRSAPYDDAALAAAYGERDVPERAFISKAFFNDRFHGR